jgi:PAS domain S-box-containing protein
MDFFRLLVARPDDSLLYSGHFDSRLVVISVCVAVFAAYTALLLSQHIAGSTRASSRFGWTLVGGLSMGAGIWAMHFIGMLAFSLPCTTTYDPFITALSMVPGVLASMLAMNLMSQATVSRPRLLVSGGLFGLGVATMHYLGMAAYRLEGLIRYDLALFGLSMLVAVGLSIVALWVKFRLQAWRPHWQAWAPVAGALVMGGAVSSMHYVGMAAAYFVRQEQEGAQQAGLAPTFLAGVVLAVTVAIIVGTLVATYLARAIIVPSRRCRGLTGLALLVWSVVAWEGAAYLNGQQLNEAYREAGGEASRRADAIGQDIDDALLRVRNVPEFFAQDAQVRLQLARLERGVTSAHLDPALRRQRWLNDPALARLSAVLADAVGHFNVATLWVVNADGDCVAASNARDKISYVGMNFSARQYFRTAQSGQPGQQYAESLVGKPSGLYFAIPVMQQGRFIGAVVAKREISSLWRWIQQANAFVVDGNGVIVLAHDKKMVYQTVPQARVATLSPQERMQQYKQADFPPVYMQAWRQQGFDEVMYLGHSAVPQFVQSRELAQGALTLYVARPVPALPRIEAEKSGVFLLLLLGGWITILIVSVTFSYEHGIRLTSKALEESQQRFRDFAQSASDWLWEMDAQLRFSYFSENIDAILGMPAAEYMLGRRRGELASLEDLNEREKWAAHLRVLEQHQPFRNFEYQFESEDGVRWFSISGVPHFDQDGRFLGYRGTGSDISQRKATEAQLRAAMLSAQTANAAKNSFLANISHEVRTPMNSVIGMAQLALRTELTEKQRDYLDKILRSARHQLQIINDILDFSKAEAGKFELESADFDFEQLMTEVEDYARGAVAAKGLELVLDVQCHFDSLLRGDSLRLKQVLMNYVSNAVKFTQRGRITVRVRLVEETLFDELLRFEVEDTGMGMDEAAQTMLFKPFNQVDASITRTHGGTGLGLAISKQLAEMMGGNVGVRSRLGQGSTFWFTARLGRGGAKVAPQAMGRHAASLGQRHYEGAHVLLAEDNPFNQQVATEVLVQAGVRVALAHNGQEAVELAQRERFDCVLMDVRMPVMDGLQATRTIRAMHDMADIPIIGLTANVDEKSRAECTDAGMTDFVGKPIEFEALFAVLDRYLGQLSPRTEETPPMNDAPHPLDAEAANKVSPPDVAVEPAVDLESFARNMNLPLSELREFVDMFFETMNQTLSEVASALQRQDISAVSELGHSAKSVARTFGAKALGHLCAELEQCRQPDALDKAQQLVARIQEEMNRVSRQLERATA